MSLARAFTMRKTRPETPEVGAGLARFASVKKRATSFDRNLISSPVALLSTTNMLSYNAPDIASLRSPSSSSSSTHSSADDSDAAGSSIRSRGSKDTLYVTDPSSCESSPTSPEPEPNHLTGYFKPWGLRRSASSGALFKGSMHGAPAIPDRALSHSKRAHERLARQRSLQHISPPDSIPEHGRVTSMELLGSPSLNPEHPFGRELEQLDEVAEEFGGAVRDAAYEEDTNLMRKKHLARYCATDYVNEIQPLFSGVFEDPYAWI